MDGRLKVLVASRCESSVQNIAAQVARAGHAIEQVVMNGQADPLHGNEGLPDVLVLRVAADSNDELEALARRDARERPPCIIVGSMEDARSMRIAMQAGARDFLEDPVQPLELHKALARIVPELASEEEDSSGRLISVINAKGGSGASFVASSIAHIATTVAKVRTVLIDADLQFGSLDAYLDLQPTRGLVDALAQSGELDQVALQAHLTAHPSGLQTLCAAVNPDVQLDSNVDRRFEHLLNVMVGAYELCVADVPRQIDDIGAIALQRSDRVLMLLQQSLPGLRDAARLKDILRIDLGIEGTRIVPVINRFDKASGFSIDDVKRSLKVSEVEVIPNRYRIVSESVDMGLPIYDNERGSTVTKALVQITEGLVGQQIEEESGFLARTFSSLRRN